uniref:Uncharacterized protein n=1 Tax=Anguilla anguilla TaxID=7936 RepID=A0A0E9Q4X3_ANGAN
MDADDRTLPSKENFRGPTTKTGGGWVAVMAFSVNILDCVNTNSCEQGTSVPVEREKYFYFLYLRSTLA